jgi:Flp pilus assembly pilin Flp
MRRGHGWLRAARSWWRDELGQGLVEYGLILAVAAVGIGAALLILRDSLGNTMAQTSNRIDSASTSGVSGVITNQPDGGTSGGSAGSSGGSGPSGGNGNGGSGNNGNGNGNGNNGNGNNGNGNGNNGNGNNGNTGNGNGNNGNGNGNGGSNGRKN